MRFLAILPALALLPSLFASNTGAPADAGLLSDIAIEEPLSQQQIHTFEVEADEVETQQRQSRGGQYSPPCEKLFTRDPRTCVCKSGLLAPKEDKRKRDEADLAALDVSEFINEGELFYARDATATLEERGKGGGNQCGPKNPPKKECICPDSPNTEIKWTGKKHDVPKCVCPGANQEWDPYLHLCQCINRCDAKRDKHNKLTCTPKPPQPSPKSNIRHSYNNAVARRKRGLDTEDRVLEDLLRCQFNERACETSGKWACTDVQSTLSTCGGCAGEAVDCANVPNVDEVRCVKGGCVIDSCQRGFFLVTDATTNKQECVASHTGKSALFSVQDK